MDSTEPYQPPYYYRWLNGDEYEEIILNYRSSGFPIVDHHPQEIYIEPKNGQIYFLKQASLRTLGFPRLQDSTKKKLFKWKKMNFQTYIPKHSPKVSYIVCSTSSYSDIAHYRMHIVQLFSKKDEEGLLLCHILQIQNKLSIDPPPKITLEFTLQEYEDIRKCKDRLSECIQRSMDIIGEVQELQFLNQMVDDDQQYILQKIYSREERIEQINLFDKMIISYTKYIKALEESYEVIQRYDDI